MTPLDGYSFLMGLLCGASIAIGVALILSVRRK